MELKIQNAGQETYYSNNTRHTYHDNQHSPCAVIHRTSVTLQSTTLRTTMSPVLI